MYKSSQEKSPINKFSLKFLKTSMEKSPESKLQRINLLSISSNERSPKQMADCDLLSYSPVVATASQLSTLSIHQNMQDIPNQGHWLGMSNFFQLITLLLIENVYFAGTRVKDPYTLAQISHSTNPSDLQEARLNIKSLDLWKACPKFNFNGPLGSTSKIPTLRPLGSTSKIQILGPLGSMSKIQDHD